MKDLRANVVVRLRIALCGLLMVSGAVRTSAQMPGTHPGYLHAIRDLREARNLLQFNFSEPAHIKAAGAALSEVNAAIADLKNASKVDEKNLDSVPPDNDSLPPVGRFHEVVDLLHSAHHDAGGPESDPAALHYRDSGVKHIDGALAAITPVL